MEDQKQNQVPANIFEEITWEDVEVVVTQMADFFKKIPHNCETGFKSSAGERIIGEILIWAALNHYEALGILEEAKLSYREIFKQITKEEREEEAAGAEE